MDTSNKQSIGSDKTRDFLEKLIREETGEGGYLGYCHYYWSVKKRILKERYGIDWKSTADRFPGVMFD